MERIVLAYSGGLHTSVAIPWLVDTYRADVVAVTLEVGQGRPLEEVRDRALAAGALRAHVLDVREEFARDYLLRSLKADAIGGRGYPGPAALARPLLARKLLEIARIEQATAIAHSATGNASLALQTAARALDPAIRILTPAQEWNMTREETIDYAKRRGISVVAAETRRLTRQASDSPDEAAFVDLLFDRGVPTTINGIPMPLVELMDTLAMIAGAHGISIDTLDAAAAVALHAAHGELQKLAVGEELGRFAAGVSRQYADLIEEGLWFTALRDALDAFVDRVQEHVNGVVRVKLFKGAATPVDAHQSVSSRTPRVVLLGARTV